jgi:hypothetical protein
MSYVQGWAVFRSVAVPVSSNVDMSFLSRSILEHVSSHGNKEAAKQDVKQRLDSEPGPFYVVEEWRQGRMSANEHRQQVQSYAFGLRTDTETLRRNMEYSAEMCRRFRIALREMYESVIDGWKHQAELLYLLEHKRLPGSKRTARLRKKRRKAIQAILIQEANSGRIWG